MRKAESHQLKKELRRACDIMRSDDNCNAARDYVEHLTWLLFLRFLDQRETSAGNYINFLEERYRWKNWVSSFIGAKLPDGRRSAPAYSEIELLQFVKEDLLPYLASLSGAAEKDIIASVFVVRNAVICNSPYNLKEVIAIVDNLDLVEEDSLQACAEFYEELLQKFSKEDISLGEFIVPPAITHFVVQILNPKIGESIYDPSCGSGTFLTEAYKYLRAQERYSQTTVGMAGQMLIGLEKKPVAALIASMNIALHGLWGGEIRRQNALETNNADIPEHFDVVMTNPPFGISTNITNQYGIQGRKSGEAAFIDHIMAKLRPNANSRCGMIVSDGVLFRPGYFKDLRKKLTEHFNISLVVSLPSGSFSYTSAKTSIIFFGLPGPTSEVLYCEIGGSRGRERANKKHEINEDDFAEIYEVWNRWHAYLRKEVSRPILSEHSWTVHIDELRERNYDLSARPMNLTDELACDTSTPELLAQLTVDSRELTAAIERLSILVNNREEL